VRQVGDAAQQAVMDDSVQCRCGLAKLGRRMPATEQRPGNQIFAFGQISDKHGFKPRFTNQPARKVDGLGIVARDGNPNPLPGLMRKLSH